MVDKNSSSIDRAFRVFISRYLSSQKQFEMLIPQEKGEFFVNTVFEALKSDKRIFIYGDYDADGVTSSTFMVEMITDFANVLGMEANISYHLPSRANHYGLNYDYFQHSLNENDLIITSDNGTHKEFFSKLTEDDFNRLLIIDHHPNGDFSKYKNVINPNTDGSVKISTGMLDEYLFQIFRAKFKPYREARKEDHFRDLTAITLISDMADLNNKLVRKMVSSGLKRMSERHRSIYRFLFPVFNGEEAKEITIEDVAFKINPILNSPGRVGVDLNFLPLLLINKKGGKVFDKYARKAIYINELRKDASNHFTQVAQKQVEKIDVKNTNLTCIDIEDCPIGLNGLIAGNLFQKYLIDTIVVSRNIQGDNIIMGSGRGEAIKAHLLELVTKFPEVSPAIEFGGHNAAIGIRILDNKLFKEGLIKYNKKKISFENLNNEHIVFNEQPISLSDYKRVCEQYGEITSSIPLNHKIMTKISAYITGVKKYRNNFLKLELSDKEGEEITIITKENHDIDYKTLKEVTLGVTIKAMSDIEEQEVIFTDTIPAVAIKAKEDIQIKMNLGSFQR